MFLHNCIPPVFGPPLLPGSHHRCPSYDEMSEHIACGVRQTGFLAHTFVECLERTKLIHFNLTGYPLGFVSEVIVSYLASQVLLTSGEVNSTIPHDHYVICIDALIEDEAAYMELCRALQWAFMLHVYPPPG